MGREGKTASGMPSLRFARSLCSVVEPRPETKIQGRKRGNASFRDRVTVKENVAISDCNIPATLRRPWARARSDPATWPERRAVKIVSSAAEKFSSKVTPRRLISGILSLCLCLGCDALGRARNFREGERTLHPKIVPTSISVGSVPYRCMLFP